MSNSGSGGNRDDGKAGGGGGGSGGSSGDGRSGEAYPTGRGVVVGVVVVAAHGQVGFSRSKHEKRIRSAVFVFWI